MVAMTSLSNRPNTAVLVVDVQNDVVAGAFRRDEVVTTIAALVDRARSSGVPVLWVQHASDELVEGSDGWAYVPELVADESEAVVHKRYGDAFVDTILATELDRLGVGRVIVAGAQTDACIGSTLHGAFVRGYDTVLVGDAHTTEDLTEYGLPSPEAIVAHTNMSWTWQRAPQQSAAVVNAADVDLGVGPAAVG
jgi:nicotinamidase-related amidase